MKSLATALILSLLPACASIQPDHLTKTFRVHYVDAQEVHEICAPSQACHVDGNVFMQAQGDWQGVHEYVMTWHFIGSWPEINGFVIRCPAWPSDELLGEVLAVPLGLPPNGFAYHALFAHEVKHVFGMNHD